MRQLYINIGGTPVPVTRAQYLCYYRGKRRMRYFERDIKTGKAIRGEDGGVIGYEPSKEDSLERILGLGVKIPGEEKTLEDTVCDTLMADRLHEALEELPRDDRDLIEALFFSGENKGMSERAYAEITGVHTMTIHSRKVRILRHLKKILGNI